jgi:outer membrane protein TolC
MKSKLIYTLYFLFTLVFGQGHNLFAQERMSLRDAIETALKNNYDILLSSNQVKVSKNNVSLANAGILPAINGNFSNNRSIQDSRQTLANGTQQERDNVRNTNTVYGFSLNWRIFDGMSMFANYERLQKLNKSDELTFRMTVENTIANVINTYYDLARQAQQIRTLRTALEISQLRLNNSNNRYKIGKASKLEVLAAKVDLNTDTTNLMRQLDNYKRVQIQLNELLGREVHTSFSTEEDINITDNLNFSELKDLAETKNPALLQASIEQQLARLNQKQVKSSRYPWMNINTGYNFNNSTSPLGFAREASGQGINIGITASIPIFNGFLQSRNEKNASIGIDNAALQYKQTQQRISAQLEIAYQTYQTNLALVKMEKENQEIAKQNLDISIEKLRLGSLSTVEFREAQLNFLNAFTRYTDAQFQAKQAEIGLKQVAGVLSL